MTRLFWGFFLLMLVHHDAMAMRCNSWIIEPEQSLYKVQQKCGAPQTTEHRTEWRMQTVFQPLCQPIMTPTPGPRQSGSPSASSAGSPQTYCTSIPVSFMVPVEVDVWYYEDGSVPKALHFENGRLVWIESLWHLRQ